MEQSPLSIKSFEKLPASKQNEDGFTTTGISSGMSLTMTQVKTDWKCPLCFQTFLSPRTLPCDHDVCEACLQAYIVKLSMTQDLKYSFNCPVCKKLAAPPVMGKPPNTWASLFPLNQHLVYRVAQTSEEITGRLCNPCTFEQKNRRAEKFCLDCQEYFCAECSLFHKKMQMSRSHRVVTYEDIVGNPSLQVNRKEELCSCQRNKAIELFCEDHNELCCGICAVVRHKRCKNVFTIPEMSEELRKGTMVEDTLDALKELRTKFENVIEEEEAKMLRLEDQKLNLIKFVHKMKKEMEEALTEMEKVTLNEIEAEFEKEHRLMLDRIDRYRETMAAVDSSYLILDSSKAQPQNDSLFVTHKNVSMHAKECYDMMDKMVKDTEVSNQLHFTMDETIKTLTKSVRKFGDVNLRRVDTSNSKGMRAVHLSEKSAMYQKAIKVSIRGESKDCFITGAAYLPGGRLVLVDNNNHKVKLIDYEDRCNSYSIAYPWDVAVIGQNRIAVTQPQLQKIHLLSTSKGLQPEKTINTERTCWGIVYSRRELIVTCDVWTYQPAILFITLNGKVKKTIEKDTGGRKLFDQPTYIDANEHGDKIYVSDTANGLLGVDRKGDLKFAYRGGKDIMGITRDGEGNVYVCGRESGEVQQLTRDGIVNSVLVKLKSKDEKFQCIAYNKLDDSFVVSYAHDSINTNDVTLFRMQ